MNPCHIPIISRFPVYPNDNSFLQYSQRGMSWTDRMKNEDVPHTVKEERNILLTMKRMVTDSCTISCVEEIPVQVWTHT
jgi:hypothetical protein